MSKSKQNFLTLDDLMKKGYQAKVFRYFLLMAHYRKPQTFSFELLDAAQMAFGRLQQKYLLMPEVSAADHFSNSAKKLLQQFDNAILNDLNFPKALAVVWETFDASLPVDQKKLLIERFQTVLGIEFSNDSVVPDNVLTLLEKRNQARIENRWAEADNLRKEIEANGYLILDYKDGSKLIRASNK